LSIEAADDQGGPLAGFDHLVHESFPQTLAHPVVRRKSDEVLEFVGV
jgi:hypothetical protein